MALTPDGAATLVASALTAQNFGGLTFTKSRWPKYALKDLATPKCHVVPIWPSRLDAFDGSGSAIETPLAITIDARLEKADDLVTTYSDLLEDIASYLAHTGVEGLGYPIEPLVIDRDEELLDAGHFSAGIGAVYRRHRETV